jgi:hypothetical protein
MPYACTIIQCGLNTSCDLIIGLDTKLEIIDWLIVNFTASLGVCIFEAGTSNLTSLYSLKEADRFVFDIFNLGT